jgi:hypothetical protein
MGHVDREADDVAVGTNAPGVVAAGKLTAAAPLLVN